MNREEILQKRREKEMEAKFGDFSARLVKRPKKDFLWGFGTQTFDENNDESCFRKGQLPTITELIKFLEIYQMKHVQVVQLGELGFKAERYAIVSSGFSGRHIFSTAKKLS